MEHEEEEDDVINFDFSMEKLDEYTNKAWDAFEELIDDDLDPKVIKKEILTPLLLGQLEYNRILNYVQGIIEELEQDQGPEIK